MFAVIGGLHSYFYVRLVRDPVWSQPIRGTLIVALITLGLSMPLTMFVARGVGSPWREVMAWPAFTWMGVMFLLFVLLLGWDVGRLATVTFLRFAFASDAAPDPARRLALARIIAGSSAVGAFGLGAIAVRSAFRPPVLQRVRVTLTRLPKTLSGFRIVQITDLHVGPTIGREYVEHVVERVNAAKPDLIAITGDLVDGGVGELERDIAPLADLKAHHGVYFVTGNHEYYAGVTHWLPVLERLGFRVLRNERVAIGSDEATFDLAGVDDFRAAGMAPGHGPDLARAVNGRDPSRELVLLAHQPAEIHNAAEHGVGLQLSGHTHGGQIWPFTYLVRLSQPYLAGLYRRGVTQIYVSCGTGYWGPPMRLGTSSEITEIELFAPQTATVDGDAGAGGRKT